MVCPWQMYGERQCGYEGWEACRKLRKPYNMKVGGYFVNDRWDLVVIATLTVTLYHRKMAVSTNGADK